MFPFFIETIANYSRSILPWFLLGIGFAYFVEKHLKSETIKRYIGVFSLQKTVSAIVLGMVSPLSIMSFLPVAREFVNLGAHAGMLFTFLVAERAYDLQSFFIITSLFGIRFAILNALAVFVSLFITAIALKNERIKFVIHKEKRHNFWNQQIRLFGIVMVGIFLSSLIRVSIPQEFFHQYAGNAGSGLVSGILSGFLIYLGPIIANYPLAKAFLDLGMVEIGVFAFLTISPVINIVIFLLFGGVVGFRTVTKAFIVYGITSLLLTLIFSLML
ncbi:MAG: permease [bacterium]|nr:permease [bacterium]